MSWETQLLALSTACLLFLTVYSVPLCAAESSISPEQATSNSTAEVQAPAAIPESTSTNANPQDSGTPSGDTGIAALEQKYFGINYEKDSLSDRILRLEKFVYGAPIKGDNDSRLMKLLKVLTPLPRRGPFAAHPIDQTAASTTEPPSKPAEKAEPTKKNLLTLINRGIDNYNKHRFHNAEDDFNEAVDMAPGLARTYAYLGVTLLQLNERASAMDAMQAAYELDPFGTFGRYAKNCLIILAGDEEIRRRGPRDDKKTVDDVLNKINKQTSSDASRYSKFANIAANDRQNTTNRFTSRIAGEHYDDGGSNDVAMRSIYARTDSGVQSRNAQKDATLRAAYSREAANNLKMLMTTKILPGGSRLRAFGTTLNTRYYGTETRNLAPWYIPREYPPELKAQAKAIKLNSKNSSKTPAMKTSRKPTGAVPKRRQNKKTRF